MDRKDDLQSLFNSFSHLTQSLMKSNNASGGKKPINLGIEAEAMLQGRFFLKMDNLFSGKTERSIFQTFWRLHCCAKFLFFELETSNFGSSYVFLSPLK